MAQITIITHTPTTGDMVAGDTAGSVVAFYSAKDKKCTDKDGTAIDCPKEIKDQLKNPNTGLIIALVALIVVLGGLSILYFSKS